MKISYCLIIYLCQGSLSVSGPVMSLLTVFFFFLWTLSLFSTQLLFYVFSCSWFSLRFIAHCAIMCCNRVCPHTNSSPLNLTRFLSFSPDSLCLLVASTPTVFPVLFHVYDLNLSLNTVLC